MAIRTIDDISLFNIANAIRSKNGSTDTYKPNQMAAAISNIPVGADWVANMVEAHWMFLNNDNATGFGNAQPTWTSLKNGENMMREAHYWQEDIDWDMPECTNAAGMFQRCGCPNVQSGYQLPGFKIKINFPKVQTLSQFCLETSYEFPAVKEVDLTTSNALTNLNGAFAGCTMLTKCHITTVASNVDLYNAFYGCINLEDLQIDTIDLSSCRQIEKTFGNCSKLVSITDIVGNSIGYQMYNVGHAFENCTLLEDIPLMDLSGITDGNGNRIADIVKGCPNLTDDSLDNLLQSCISSRFTGTKTLYYLGLREEDYPTARLEALPHWTDFTQAGWSAYS